MKRSFIFSGVIAFLITVTFSGCYYGIPTVVEVVNQDRISKEEQGRRPESKTGAIRLLTSNKIDQQDRLNNVIRGYNAIMSGTFNVIASQHILKKDTIPALQTSSHMAFPVTEHLSQGVEYFRWSRRITPYTQSELNVLIPQAIKLGQKLLDDETSTAPYFTQGVYRRDHYAGAKKMLPILEQDYARLIDVLNQIGQILFQLQQTDIQNQIHYYESTQDQLGIYCEQSLYLAMQIVSEFQKDVSAIKQGTIYARTRHNVQQLETLLLKYQDRIKLAQNAGIKHADKQRIIDSLNGMVESYKELLQNRSYITFNLMIKRYSEAIDAYNKRVSY